MEDDDSDGDDDDDDDSNDSNYDDDMVDFSVKRALKRRGWLEKPCDCCPKLPRCLILK